MAGIVKEKHTQQHEQVYENNLRYAAGIFEKENIIGLIEPINKYAVPDYYLNDYTRGATYFAKIKIV